MSQPSGFVDKDNPTYVCKLHKSLYGLKQAPRAWYTKLKGCLLDLGFQRSVSDFSLFFRVLDGKLLIILVYVDDILLTGDSDDDVLHVIQLLQSQFKLKTFGEVQYFLGIEVTQCESGYLLSQKKYVTELLQRTNMQDCTPSPTPMITAPKLSKDGGKVFTDPSLYRSVVGSLQYLTLTRPDIAFSVNKLSQYMQAPGKLHWDACRRLLKYLKGTSSFGIKFSAAPPSNFALEGFSDADYAGCIDDLRSTGGHCVYLGGNLIVWNAKKQEVVSRSSTESEYRSLANLTCDIMWLQSLCKELGVVLHSAPPRLWCDNSGAIALSANPVFHSRTKHIEVDIHFVREKVLAKLIEVGYVPSKDQVADVFTKPLAEARFKFLRQQLRLIDMDEKVVGKVFEDTSYEEGVDEAVEDDELEEHSN